MKTGVGERIQPRHDSIALFAMGKKGLATLTGLLESGARLSHVVLDRDQGVVDDHSEAIAAAARQAGIPTSFRGDQKEPIVMERTLHVASGWRWMIRDVPPYGLVILHDSLLPRYRGFAPLVNALINGETELGVTALWASHLYDSGPIIAQRRFSIEYPVTIAAAIDLASRAYFDLAKAIGTDFLHGGLTPGTPQDERHASISIWRDQEDYAIPWNTDAEYVRRFVDAVGTPYAGARTWSDNIEYIVERVEVVRDVAFEITHPGKVYDLRGGFPLVTCGSGAVMITSMRSAASGSTALPFHRVRVRFR